MIREDSCTNNKTETYCYYNSKSKTRWNVFQMALEANRQKETRTQRQSFLFQFSQWNLERILFILYILL